MYIISWNSIYKKHKYVHTQSSQQFKYSNNFSRGHWPRNLNYWKHSPLSKSKQITIQTQQTPQKSFWKYFHFTQRRHSGTHPNLFPLNLDSVWRNLLTRFPAFDSPSELKGLPYYILNSSIISDSYDDINVIFVIASCLIFDKDCPSHCYCSYSEIFLNLLLNFI